MDGELGPVISPRIARLAGELRDKRFRDAYVAASGRRTLAQQMRKFRAKESQAAFAQMLGKQPTTVARLENPSYSGWSLRTMLEIAEALDVAVFVRFVDFPTFLKLSDDLSAAALRPAPYDEKVVDTLVGKEESKAADGALKALFSKPPEQQRGATVADRAYEKISPTDLKDLSRFDREPANDDKAAALTATR